MDCQYRHVEKRKAGGMERKMKVLWWQSFTDIFHMPPSSDSFTVSAYWIWRFIQESSTAFVRSSSNIYTVRLKISWYRWYSSWTRRLRITSMTPNQSWHIKGKTKGTTASYQVCTATKRPPCAIQSYCVIQSHSFCSLKSFTWTVLMVAWQKDYMTVPTSVPVVPEAIIKLVKCQCQKSKCS